MERILHTNAEDGFTVARLEVSDGRPITVVGILPGIHVGEILRCEGQWVKDPRFGEQFRVETWLSLRPSTLAGIEKYLGSGVIRGLGPTLAGRLVARFGVDTLQVIEREPRRLSEVPGLGQKRIAEIARTWTAGKEGREVMVFLQGHGVSPAFAGRIVRRYGHGTVAIVSENPYRLAEDVAGIGFRTADRIAAALGMGKDAPQRLRAALVHLLRETAQEGHTCFPDSLLLQKAARVLEVEESVLYEPLASLVREGVLKATPPTDPSQPLLLALPELATMEEEAAADLIRLLRSPPIREFPDTEKTILWAEERLGLALAPAQREAVQLALCQKVLVVTGGPGTGKTTLLKVLMAVLATRRVRVELAAPTGRAAQRMSEATQVMARTLHRILDYQPMEGRFRKDRRHPLRVDQVIVDEASMIDQPLLASLLAALPSSARLLLVGDVDQLPSVGPGRVLGDLLDSGVIPVARLEKVYRQAEGSRITYNAHRIRMGETPEFSTSGEEGDFFLVHREDGEAAAETIVELVSHRIPKAFSLDPQRDIQVLAPMHRGRAGASALNQILQASLNPAAADQGEVQRGGRIYREGDRVMQGRNDYEREVWNGDLGRVSHIDLDRGEVKVRFEDRVVGYEIADLDALQPAYAISIHKSQGSEYPAVVIPLLTEHFVMLRRNLLYTAVTRARRLVVLVGSPRALSLALRESSGEERRTRLTRQLREAAGTPGQERTTNLPLQGGR